MTRYEFEQTIFSVANRSPICETPIIRRSTPTSIGIRVPMTMGGFVDAFFNEQTGTIAFALIQNDVRIFGADNTGGWHLHPFSDPEKHQSLTHTISFAKFIAAIEQYDSHNEK
jgi:hypothetical protein